MKREDLRKVKYKGVVENKETGLFEGAWLNGYFHMWFNGADFNKLYAVVETEEGYIDKIESHEIKFVGNDNSFFGEVIID